MLSDVSDLLRIVALIPVTEAWRRLAGPRRSATHFRKLGGRMKTRTSGERERLRRLIRYVDVRLPDRGNCYRRALIEIALDPTAATEPLHFGLVQHGGPQSGHAWLEGDTSVANSYDADFII
jgi:Transglutaminase-like superfamily